MTHARFIADVAEAGGFLPDQAEEYAVAVIATLEERLPLDEVFALEAHLPSRLDALLAEEPILDLPDMDREQFSLRVAMRLGVSRVEAESITEAVFSVLRTRLSPAEVERVEVELPAGLRPLWTRALPLQAHAVV
jgi:uncharacterized protein (DUF2267 family)